VSEYISIENLIKEATKRGVDLGKGDPYNRLRYYTKMGWLPHMVRKKESGVDEVKGHYPSWAVDRLIFIEELKSKKLSNEEITERIHSKNRVQTAYSLVDPKKIRTKIIAGVSIILILFIVAVEAGIVNIGRHQRTVANHQITKIIVDDGYAYVPSGQRRVMVKSPRVQANSKVYVTFTQNYSPAQRFWVSRVLPLEGFEIELDAPVFEDSEFTWWVSN
jgi:hypothetical protein